MFAGIRCRNLSFIICLACFAPFAAAQQVPLRFVGDKDYPPLSYIDHGESAGFDVDVLKAIAPRIGRQIQIALIDSAEAQVRAQRGDAGGLTDLAISDERRAIYEFAASIVTHDFGLFVRVGDIARAIATLRADGTLQRIQDRWRLREVVFFSRQRAGGLAFQVAAAVLGVLLLASVAWALALKRQVRQRREAETELAGSKERLELALGAEREVARRNRLFAYALESANDCISITDADDRFLYVNDAFLKMYEFTSGEVIGRHVSLIRPDAPAGAGASLDASERFEGEVMNQSKSGRVFPVALSRSVVRDEHGERLACIGVARDITSQKLAEKALRASEAKFSQAFEMSPDVIAITDMGPRGLLAVNEAFERVTGYSRDEVLGRTLNDVGAMADPEFRDEALAMVAEQGSGRDVEFQIRRKNGEAATLVASGAVIDVAGASAYLVVARDVSDEKRLEIHLRQAAELNKLLLAEMDLDRLAVAIVDAARAILPLSYASLVLRDADGGLAIKAQSGELGSGRARSAAVAIAAAQPPGSDTQLLRAGDLAVLGADTDDLRAVGVHTACSLRLSTSEGWLGTMLVGSGDDDAFTGGDLTLLQQLSTYAAIALQNARSFQEITVLKDRLSSEKLYLEEEIRVEHNFADIVGESAAIKRVLRQIETVAPTDASVLILGETGTGKELLARAIHNLSPRKSHTFVKMNAAALPATLFESELFGYERGAFTGAVSARVGRMELAYRSTLFLDEVGDVPLELQPKLLRVLQEREFERLGSHRTLRVDVRLIAATNRDLQQMVDGGTFRGDLFYRLNAFPVYVPPLRERPEDIPVLVRHFVQKFGARLKRRSLSIPAPTMRALQEWEWPGNIRELENVIERAVIVSNGETLEVPPFPARSTGESDATRTQARRSTPSDAPSSSLADAERETILRALRESDGVVSGPHGAAARLGIKRTTLQSKMRKLGIRRPRY
jgi:formate hydrogenlyase transcriptional activator